MIRDPSDGSVRETREIPALSQKAESAQARMTTALPPLPKDTKQAARLVESRNWLKNYHKKGQ